MRSEPGGTRADVKRRESHAVLAWVERCASYSKKNAPTPKSRCISNQLSTGTCNRLLTMVLTVVSFVDTDKPDDKTNCSEKNKECEVGNFTCNFVGKKQRKTYSNEQRYERNGKH